MRRKLNQKGVAISTVVILGAAVVATVAYFNVRVEGVNSQVMHALRRLSMWLDTQVYSIASFAYSIFYELSSSSLLSSLNLASASQRLYTLIGIFMLFRLAFSFVKYIINPEGMEKGTSKLLSNLAISLALIVSVPWIFNRAFVLQTYIMDSNVIGNLIMGMDASNKKQTFNAGSYGQSIAFLTFSAFFRPNYSAIPSLSPCSNLLTYYSDDLEIENGDNGKPQLTPKKISDNELYKLNELIAQCVNNLNDLQYTVDDTSSSVEIGTYFYIASQRQDIGVFSMAEILTAVVSGEYVVSYTGVVSTIAGGFLALLFLNFSFDVAIRNVKLCFMQIIAPIPIILNIEPGDSKGDKKSLNWWVKESLKAYTDLFIRVATVYFGVYLINVLFGQGTVAGSTNSSVWFQVFMILGILLFVKQIPDLIGKAFGIDVKGQFSLNPLKRIGDSRLASMAVGGAAGLIGGLGTGITAGIAAHRAGANLPEALAKAISGGVGGTLHSAVGGAKTGAKSFHDIWGNTKNNWSRSGRIAGSNVGSTWSGRTAARLSMLAGVPTKADRMEKDLNDIKKIDSVTDNLRNLGYNDNTDYSSYHGSYQLTYRDSSGGSVTKPISAIFGTPVYNMRDIHEAVENQIASGTLSAGAIADLKRAEEAAQNTFYEDNLKIKGSRVEVLYGVIDKLSKKQAKNLPGIPLPKSVRDALNNSAAVKAQAAAFEYSKKYTTEHKNKNAAASRGPGGGN